MSDPSDPDCHNCRDCKVLNFFSELLSPMRRRDHRRWEKDTLTWWAPADQPDFLAAISVGIERWRPAIDIDFIRVDSADDADMVCTLGKIDGNGQTLAYAYFPDKRNGPLAGDVVFDEEDFKRLSHEGRIEVLAHEFGHSLGLDHSGEGQRSLMAPYYAGDENAGMLWQLDRERIQGKYPPRQLKGS
ncbi:MAG: matrixin family metalloprotease [Verrucomicrobiota bacterium]